MAGVGMTESRARETIGSIAVYTSDFRAMKNVLAGRNERALYKMICDAETGRVVGLHMIGPDAPEILQAAAVAVKTGLTKDAFDQTVALHPSMAEELVLMQYAGLVVNAFPGPSGGGEDERKSGVEGKDG